MIRGQEREIFAKGALRCGLFGGSGGIGTNAPITPLEVGRVSDEVVTVISQIFRKDEHT
jgi:hypothetical protein